MILGWLRRWRAGAPARRNRGRGTHCYYCGVQFTATGPRQRTIDHRHPRSAGGSDQLANTVFACRACNERKADQPEDDFAVSDWLSQRRAEVVPRPHRAHTHRV